MLSFLQVLQFLVLALWVGAMFGFGALFAPVLFRNLSSRDQAGTIAGEALARIDSLGLVAGGIMLVVTALQAIDRLDALNLGRVLLAVVMLALVLLTSITVRGRLNAIRQQMGRPIDEFGPEDPLRKEYNKYHRLSRSIFSMNLLLGVLQIVLSALPPK